LVEDFVFAAAWHAQRFVNYVHLRLGAAVLGRIDKHGHAQRFLALTRARVPFQPAWPTPPPAKKLMPRHVARTAGRGRDETQLHRFRRGCRHDRMVVFSAFGRFAPAVRHWMQRSTETALNIADTTLLAADRALFSAQRKFDSDVHSLDVPVSSSSARHWRMP